jgi:hypothetical protein
MRLLRHPANRAARLRGCKLRGRKLGGIPHNDNALSEYIADYSLSDYLEE